MRGTRSLAAKLAAVVLGFEAIIVFLGGMVAFGLRALPEPLAPWWTIVVGSALALAMIIVAGMIHRPGALVVGWVLQALTALSGILLPPMLIVVLIFGGMYAYATINGPRIEARARNAAPEGE